MKLRNITLHILPGLAFDVIIGFSCIRKYNLITNSSYLFSESNLQVHNCTKCRQCLPKVYSRRAHRRMGNQAEGPVGGPLCKCVKSPTWALWSSWWLSGGSPKERSAWRSSSCVGPTGADMQPKDEWPCSGATALDCRCCGWCVLQAPVHACSTPRSIDIQNIISRYLEI